MEKLNVTIMVSPFLSMDMGFFPSLEVLHQYYPDHYIVKCKIIDLLEPVGEIVIERWKYNRPPDEVRCQTIAKNIFKNRLEMDTMIYMNYNSDAKRLEIIDGMHRYCSLQILHQNEVCFPNIREILFHKYILLNIRVDYTDGQLRDLFLNINSSIPVPELYIREDGQEKRMMVENTVKYFQTRFESHFSPKMNFNTPNINRETLFRMLDEIYNKYEFDAKGRFSDMIHLLMKVNEQIEMKLTKFVAEKRAFSENDNGNENGEEKGDPSEGENGCRKPTKSQMIFPEYKKCKITQSIYKKCHQTRCWLFILKYDDLMDYIDKVYHTPM